MRQVMDLSLTEAERRLRDEVRAWLADHLPAAWRGAEGFEVELAWQRRLHEGGWVGVHWPPEHGGRGLSPLEHLVVIEELALAGAPDIANRVGVNLAGPTLMAHGTPAQRARFLRPILSGEEIWCQLYSEPGAGSDLASVATRAERRGGRYLLYGQKVWSSYAQRATFGLALVRTDPEAPRHRGLSCLVVPMDAPGVEVRPLRQMTGESEFCEVFLDGAPVPAGNLVGAPGEGWRVAMTTLGHERGLAFPVKEWGVQRALFDRLVRLVREGLREDGAPAIRQRLAGVRTDLEILRLLNLRAVSRLARGGEPGPEASVTKLQWSAVSRRLAELALEVLGPRAPADGFWGRRHLWSRSASIAGGTDEVQRTVLAERVLGMPR